MWPLYAYRSSSLLYLSLCLLSSRPVGVFEFEKFASGSKAVLEAVVATTEKGATSIIG